MLNQDPHKPTQESETLRKESSMKLTHTFVGRGWGIGKVNDKQQIFLKITMETCQAWYRLHYSRKKKCFFPRFCGVCEQAIFLFFLEPWFCRVEMNQQQPHKWRGRLRWCQDFILVVVRQCCTTAMLQKLDRAAKRDKLLKSAWCSRVESKNRAS